MSPSNEWLRMQCSRCGTAVVVPSDDAPPLAVIGDYITWSAKCPGCEEPNTMFEILAAHPPDDEGRPPSGSVEAR